MITSLIGSNKFVLFQKKKGLVRHFIEKYGDIAVESYESDAEMDIIRSALLNLPFLVEKKLIILDEPSTNKNLSERLLDWLSNIDDTTDVLIIEPTPDKRTSWYKFLIKNTQVMSCDEIDENSIRKWILDVINEKKGKIDPRAVNLLLKNSGLNQQQLYNDIEKLINYNPTITEETVDLLIEPIPQDTVFSLLEALICGDTEKTIKLYDSLRLSGVDDGEILAMMGWQVHTLLLVKSALKSKNEDSGLHPYVVQKNSAIAKNLTFGDLERLLFLIINSELSIKKDGLQATKVVSVLIYEILGLLNKKTT